MARYKLTAAAMPTTSAVASVATGAAIKTLLQLKPRVPGKITAWGISFDGTSVATPGKVELIETDVAATVTALANADLHKLDAEAVALGDPTSLLIEVGTSATGYNASGEGSITAVRLFDVAFISPTNQYAYQFPLGQEPYLQVGKFTRIRVTFGAGINAYPWIDAEF